MQCREYTTKDKSDWPRGEWDNEPDKVQFQDEATGLPCLIIEGAPAWGDEWDSYWLSSSFWRMGHHVAHSLDAVAMICESPDCGQVALSTLTTACGRACLCGSCMEQVFGVLTQEPDEVGEALRETFA